MTNRIFRHFNNLERNMTKKEDKCKVSCKNKFVDAYKKGNRKKKQ